MSKPLPGAADDALAAGYTPDPDCECDGTCRWCAHMGCETCCNAYMNGDHGVRDADEADVDQPTTRPYESDACWANVHHDCADELCLCRHHRAQVWDPWNEAWTPAPKDQP